MNFAKFILPFLFAASAFAAAPEKFVKINQWIREGQEDLALARLNVLLSEEPENIRALNLRGNLNFHRKDYMLALADFSDVIKLAPDHVNGFVSRAAVYHALGYHKAAFKDVSSARKLKPESPFIHNLKLKIENDTAVRMKNGPVNMKKGSVKIKKKA